MLVRLLPSDVCRMWDQLWPYVEITLSPTSVPSFERGAEVLRAVMEESLVFWLYEEGNVPIGVITTMMTESDYSAEKELVLYSIAVFPGKKVSKSKLPVAFATLRAHATSLGCKRMTTWGYDRVTPKLLRLCGIEEWREYKFYSWRIS